MRDELLSEKELKELKKFYKKYRNYLAYVDLDFPKKKKVRGNNAEKRTNSKI